MSGRGYLTWTSIVVGIFVDLDGFVVVAFAIASIV